MQLRAPFPDPIFKQPGASTSAIKLAAENGASSVLIFGFRSSMGAVISPPL
jgi:hypothetical protein